MKRFFFRLIQVGTAYPDIAIQRQAQRLLIINFVWLVILVLGLPFVVAWMLRTQRVDVITVFIPLTFTIALLTHWQIQHARLGQARVLFVCNVLVTTLLTIFPNYRLDTPFVIALTLPVVAAGVLLRRSGLFGTALALVFILSIGATIQIASGMEDTPLLGDAAARIEITLVLVVFIITLITVIMWAFVSGMDQAVEEQHRLAGVIETVSQISQTLATIPTTGEALNHAVEQLRDMLGLYHVQIFTADPATGLAVLQASTGFIGRRLLEEDTLLKPDADSPINDALRRADPILIREDAPAEQRSGFLPVTRSELLLPLQVGDLLPLGVLDLHSTSANGFPKPLFNALKTIANQLATALYGVQQAKEQRSSYQEREQLLERIEASQREVARLNRQLIGATWGTYLEERKDAVPGFDWQPGQLSAPSTPPVLLHQTLDDGRPRLERRDGGDVLCVPIRLRGQTLGAVEFTRTGSTGWSAAALDLAQAVAERLALALENARLFEQAQATARREQLVSRVTAQLQTSTDLQVLLTQAAVQFQEALGAVQTRVRLGQLPGTGASE